MTTVSSSNDFTYSKAEPRARKPFWMSRRQIYQVLQVMPLLLMVWVILIFGFKNELNPFGDESGYHEGGVQLAQSLSNGTFFHDALDPDLFKYPGYYAFAGVIYSIFGEHPLLLRALGLVPFCLLAIVVANIASLIGGERARIFAFMTALFSPVLLFFSLQILRDIYIACAVAVILHAIVVFVQSKQSVHQFISLPLLFAFSVIYLTRRPQGILMIAFAFFWVCNAKVWLLPRNWRNYVFVVLNLVFVGLMYIYWKESSERLFSIFMDNPEGTISITHHSALSDVTFTSGDEIAAALMNPKFVLVTLVAKLTSFTLGANPFTHSESSGNVLDLFEEFNPLSWGGLQWEDVLLVYGLQWIENLLLLVFLLAGLIGLWRYNRKVFVVMAMHWAIYAFITMFSANDIRWGLPSMIIFCVSPALGYAWFGGRLNQLRPSMWMLFFVVIAVRFYGIAIPMIIVPIAMFALIIPQLKARDPNIICI